MFKTLFFAIKVGVLIALAVWVADQPGTVRIDWMEYRITTHVGFFFLAAIAFVLITLFIYQTIKTFVDFPKSLRRYNEINTREKGYVALTKGLAAVAAGDTKAANIQAKRAAKFLEGDTGLPMLLEAQAARLEGREDDAVESFTMLLENKHAGFLGVRGLLQSALDNGDKEGALALAEKALKSHPKQGWLLNIVYDLQIDLRRWYAAEKTLTKAEKIGVFDKDKAQSDRIALMLAQVQKDMDDGYVSDAHLTLKKAFKKAPDFAPAAVMMAEYHVGQGQVKAAQKVIKKAWKANPHGALAMAWIDLQDEGDKSDKLSQLRWMEKLIKVNDDSAIGLRLAGQIAFEAGLWGEAREFFKRSEALRPSAALYRAWAKLEEKAGENPELAKNYFEKSLDAPADKTWVCTQSGAIYDHWSPIAEPHGAFNTIEWKRPFEVVESAALVDKKPSLRTALIDAPETDAA